jgi:hypothetical protein
VSGQELNTPEITFSLPWNPENNITITPSFQANSPGEEPGTNPGEEPGTNPSEEPGTNPGEEPGTNPGEEPGTNPGEEPGTNPGEEQPNIPGHSAKEDQNINGNPTANAGEESWQLIWGRFTQKGLAALQALLAIKEKGSEKAKELGANIHPNREFAYLFADDLSLPDGIQMPKGGINVSIPYATAKQGDRYLILHYDEAREIWEAKEVTAEDGSIHAHFDTLSPIVLYKAGEETKQTPSEQNQNTNTGKTAPKTGEETTNHPERWYAVCGIGAFLGLLLRRKKSRRQAD